MSFKIDLTGISKLRTYTDDNSVSSLVVSKGCSLKCAYCINPETWDNSTKTKKFNAEELYNELKKYNIYYLATGGGVIFGGGEPLLHHSFIKEFIEKYKHTGWKFTLETCLNVKKEYLEELINLIDFFIVDIKDMDKNRYELYTKGDYDLFISNLKYLLKNVGFDKILLRVPIIPKLHTSNEAEDNCKKLKDMGFKNIEIFKYIDPEKINKEISNIAKLNKKYFLNYIQSVEKE